MSDSIFNQERKFHPGGRKENKGRQHGSREKSEIIHERLFQIFFDIRFAADVKNIFQNKKQEKIDEKHIGDKLGNHGEAQKKTGQNQIFFFTGFKKHEKTQSG